MFFTQFIPAGFHFQYDIFDAAVENQHVVHYWNVVIWAFSACNLLQQIKLETEQSHMFHKPLCDITTAEIMKENPNRGEKRVYIQ